jgi:polyisoprenoid-binding protein YceI
MSGQLICQNYYTRDGSIVFESDAPIEQIEAVNNKAICVWDTESGAIEMAVLIQSFKFEKALMEEHFNENYMESEKYPKAKFKGKVLNMSSIHLDKDGTYTADVEGDLTMHGQTQTITLQANVVVANGVAKTLATFNIAVEDYKIKIPSIVKDKIAKIVQVRVDLDLKLLEK